VKELKEMRERNRLAAVSSLASHGIMDVEEDTGMVKVKRFEIPSERAKRKLERATARMDKALHALSLAEARAKKWSQRATAISKRLATPGYYEALDAKARKKQEERGAAFGMKVAMGLVKPTITEAMRRGLPTQRSGQCVMGAHGLCGGRCAPGVRGEDKRGRPCYCQCHNQNEGGKVVTG
jgi:hypothetical protein